MKVFQGNEAPKPLIPNVEVAYIKSLSDEQVIKLTNPFSATFLAAQMSQATFNTVRYDGIKLWAAAYNECRIRKIWIFRKKTQTS